MVPGLSNLINDPEDYLRDQLVSIDFPFKSQSCWRVAQKGTEINLLSDQQNIPVDRRSTD